MVDVRRFRTFYGNGDSDLLDRVFAPGEISDSAVRSDTMAYLAICFAAKEAVLKTIGGIEQGMARSDIVISAATSARPGIRLDGETRAVADHHGVDEFFLATGYARQVASALVIAYGSRVEGVFGRSG